MSTRLSTSEITQAVVVVPARDEQELLPRCLTALRRASAQVPVPVLVVVVLDRCTDGTAQAAQRAGVLAVPSSAGRVGAARAQGVAAAEQALGDVLDPKRTWLASTDADSQVPARWLSHHLALADDGADLVVGTVDLEGAAGLEQLWATRYQQAVTASQAHPHVHGANLGVRWGAYLAAGGFAALRAHEDVALVQAVTAVPGARVVRTLGEPVRTSNRLLGRAPAGVARDLSALASGCG